MDVYINEVLVPNKNIFFLNPIIFTEISIGTYIITYWPLYGTTHFFLHKMIYLSQYFESYIPWRSLISWFCMFLKFNLMIKILSYLCVVSCELHYNADEKIFITIATLVCFLSNVSYLMNYQVKFYENKSSFRRIVWV